MFDHKHVIAFRNGRAMTNPIRAFDLLATLMRHEHDEPMREVMDQWHVACKTSVADFSEEQMGALRVELSEALQAFAVRQGITLRTKESYAKGSIGWLMLEEAGAHTRTLVSDPSRRDLRRARRAAQSLKALEAADAQWRQRNRRNRTINMLCRNDIVAWRAVRKLPDWTQDRVVKVINEERRARAGTTFATEVVGG